LKREQTKDLKGGGEPNQQEEENPINRRRRTQSTGGGEPNQDEARCKAEYLRNFAKSSLALGFCVFKEENLTPDIRFINPPISSIFLISCTIVPYKVDLKSQVLLAARAAARAATFFLFRVVVRVRVLQRWRTLSRTAERPLRKTSSRTAAARAKQTTNNSLRKSLGTIATLFSVF
jgi:hypothetical protein